MNTLNLRDAKLLRDQAYIDGGWQAADNARTITIRNPANQSGPHARPRTARRSCGAGPN
jgi:hypothetical protein